jgi:hypothetical protein
MIAETSTYADLPLALSFRFGDLAELPSTLCMRSTVPVSNTVVKYECDGSLMRSYSPRGGQYES